MLDQVAFPAPLGPVATEAGPATSPAGAEDELLLRLRAGEESAFAVLVARESGPLLRLAWRLTGQRSDAEDLAQEALLRFYRHLPTFRGDAAISTWLYRTVTRLALDHLRRQRLRRAVFFWCDDADMPAVEDVADPGGNPQQLLEQRQLAQALTVALRRLPPRQQTVFVLRHYEGLPLAEVARLLSTREGTVKCHLHRALAALRRVCTTLEGD